MLFIAERRCAILSVVLTRFDGRESGVSGQSDRLFGFISMYCHAAVHSSKAKTPKTATTSSLETIDVILSTEAVVFPPTDSEMPPINRPSHRCSVYFALYIDGFGPPLRSPDNQRTKDVALSDGILTAAFISQRSE